MRIGIVTYNIIGGPYAGLPEASSGLHENGENSVLLLQNTHGKGIDVDSELEPRERSGEIEELWGRLCEDLASLDYVVIYVGTSGSDNAIAAAANRLPAEKTVFVLCDCGVEYKLGLIREAGLEDSRKIWCECGGHTTLRKLFDHFMRTGNLNLPR